MVTRVRIEAEGSTPQEVLQQMEVAHQCLTSAGHEPTLDLLFGTPNERHARPGLADAQAGECVIERYARDASDDPDRAGHGAIVYKGRMTSHYAKPQKLEKLTGHSNLPAGPYAEVSPHTVVLGEPMNAAPTEAMLREVVHVLKPGTRLQLHYGSERVGLVLRRIVAAADLQGSFTRIARMESLAGDHWLVEVEPAPPHLKARADVPGEFEVTSTLGEAPVDRVPALNVSTDAKLTRERLIATWNENVPPVQRPHAQPLRLYVVPGDMFVYAHQLWLGDEQLQVLYERPIEHPNLSPRQWMVSPQARAGG
jgi:hypothetical protein